MRLFSVLLILQLQQYHISGRFSKKINTFFPAKTEVTLAFSETPAGWKLVFQLTFCYRTVILSPCKPDPQILILPEVVVYSIRFSKVHLI